MNKINKGLMPSFLVSSFLGDFVLSIFYIYLPLFASQLGASTLEVGIVGGADYSIYTFLPFFIGRFSDRVKSRILLIVVALGILSVSSLLYAIAPNAAILVIVRVFEGIGWAILWPVIEAGISEEARENSQKALGRYNFVWSFASMLGPIGGALLIFLLSIRVTFLITAFVLIVALVVNVPYLRRRSLKVNQEQKAKRPLGFGADLRETLIALVSKNKILLIANVVVNLSISTFLTFFPPFAESNGVPILMIGVLTFSFAGSRFVTYMIVLRERTRSKIISLRSRNKLSLVSMGLASISGVFLAFLSLGYLPFFVGFVLLGSSFALVTTLIQVAMISESPVSQMGAGAGLIESSMGVGSFLGPVVAGLVSGGSPTVPFFVPPVIFLLILPLIGYILRK